MIRQIDFIKDQRTHLFLLIGLATIVNYLLFLRFGIKVVNDSPRYLSYANQLKDGYWYEHHNFWYFGYVLFIFIVKFFNDSLHLLIFCQVSLHIFALIALYYSAIILFNDSLAAFLSGLSYLFFLEIPSWNFYVLAESIYGSFICFTLYFIARAQKKPDQWIIALPFICYTFFIKPTGIALIFAVGVFGVIFFRKFFNKHKIALLVFTPIAAVLLYLLLNSMLGSFVNSILANDYAKGEIIYGVTSVNNFAYIDVLTVESSSALSFPASDQPPIVRLFMFFVNNPFYYLKLCATKLFFHLSHIRPYYSILHNIYTALYLYPLYFFFCKSLFNLPLNKAFKGFIIAFLAVHSAIVMVTTVDWDGRFIVPMLPAIFLIASPEISSSTRYLIQRRNRGLNHPSSRTMSQ